jgi:F420-0:gamma-glutamyl ligase-like protein
MSISAMTTTDYLINAALILLVVRQIRERRVDVRSLILPAVLVYTIAGSYLHSVPTAGNDLVLTIGLATLGLILGSTSALFHTMRVGSDGVALARAGWIAAGLWIAGMGARITFVLASENGAGNAIEHFSAANSITGKNAWVTALVLMAVCEVVGRLATLQLRAYRLTNANTHARMLAGAGA